MKYVYFDEFFNISWASFDNEDDHALYLTLEKSRAMIRIEKDNIGSKQEVEDRIEIFMKECNFKLYRYQISASVRAIGLDIFWIENFIITSLVPLETESHIKEVWHAHYGKMFELRSIKKLEQCQGNSK